MNSIKSAVYKKNRLNFILALLGSIGNAGIAEGVAFLLREFVDISISGSMDALYRMLCLFCFCLQWCLWMSSALYLPTALSVVECVSTSIYFLKGCCSVVFRPFKRKQLHNACPH